MEEFRPVQEFQVYSVSDQGRVLNEKTGRILRLSENQKGVVIAGFMRGGVQYKRAVSALVARTFLPRPKLEAFTHTINKDGDRRNNHAENLEWRPYWFSRKYHVQFDHRFEMPEIAVADMQSGAEFASVWDAAMTYGLLVGDILESIDYQTSVWPTNQRFWRVD